MPAHCNISILPASCHDSLVKRMLSLADLRHIVRRPKQRLRRVPPRKDNFQPIRLALFRPGFQKIQDVLFRYHPVVHRRHDLVKDHEIRSFRQLWRFQKQISVIIRALFFVSSSIGRTKPKFLRHGSVSTPEVSLRPPLPRSYLSLKTARSRHAYRCRCPDRKPYRCAGLSFSVTTVNMDKSHMSPPFFMHSQQERTVLCYGAFPAA